jgi:hypothetical protein
MGTMETVRFVPIFDYRIRLPTSRENGDESSRPRCPVLIVSPTTFVFSDSSGGRGR